MVFAYDTLLQKNLSLLLHILVLFKNDASLPLGKKNEQSAELFTKKNPKQLCSSLANNQQRTKELAKLQKQRAVSQVHQRSSVMCSFSEQCFLMRNMNTGY